MAKTTSLSKKLKSYSAVAGALAAASGAAHAQIIYTDVNPDITVGAAGIYNLDLNNDGLLDFTLQQRSGTIYTFIQYDVVGVNPEFTLNAVDTLGSEAAHAADAGFTIDSTLNWVDSTVIGTQFPPTAAGLAAVIPGFGSGGNFLGQNGKFLPLRFYVEGETFFGWVRLDVASDALSFKVIDYAYRNAALMPIVTGVISDVGINEPVLSSNADIFSYGKNITVTLGGKLPVTGTISVTNLLGQEIMNTKITDSRTILPLDNAKTGIYLVTIRQAGDIYTKRVSIK